jgi:hypothetical protein
MKFSTADSRVRMLRFADVSGANSVPGENFIDFCRREIFKTFSENIPIELKKKV